jgi:nitroreductase
MTNPLHQKNANVTSPMSLKARAKAALQERPHLWSLYWRTKQQIRRVLLLRYFLYDISHTYKAMHWNAGHTEKVTLAAELLFQYHKIEKGLVMPGPPRLFAVEPALATMALSRRWILAGHAVSDPVYVGALETLEAYRRRLEEFDLDPRGNLLPRLISHLTEFPMRNAELVTPRQLPSPITNLGTDGHSAFGNLAMARRSVREFTLVPVSNEILRRAVLAAQLAPSACNRQPCRIRIVSGEVAKKKLLGHQNGNRGFGHLAPHVAILTADERCFFDASERHEPYIDGGLFAMNFILSLREQGVSSCCLNWCVPPATDRTTHQQFEIPGDQRIVMLIAYGYAPVDCMVPRSPRRSLAEVLHFMD